MPTFAPHVERAVIEINNRFTALGNGTTYPGHGEDGSKYAADFWSTNKAVHDRVLKFILEDHKRLGVKYIITWERIWSDARSNEGIRHYRRDANRDGTLSPSERHTNHVHISFNVEPPEEDDDMPLTDADWAKFRRIVQQEVAKVWELDVIPNPTGDAANPTLVAKNSVAEIRKDTDEILKKLDS